MISEEEIVDTLERKLPGFHPKGSLELLEGGNLNHVWRVRGDVQSVIVKVAPPHIATNPEVPLSPKRIQFEANALQLFREGNLFYPMISNKIRPPRCLFFDQQKHLLALEDFGELPDIGQAIKTLSKPDGFGRAIGNFIGQLHQTSYQRDEFANSFNNDTIQRTRLDVQYKPAADYAREGGVQKPEYIREKTVTLGQQLLDPGRCLVMGDLWPLSILVDENQLRLIDWEFCHFGRPLQDIGHFAAHCWMQAHTASTNKTTKYFKQLWIDFWEEYQNVLGELYYELINKQEIEDTATHIGAEILIRTTGPFKNGYVYQSLSTDHLLVQEATQKASDLIAAIDFSSLWE